MPTPLETPQLPPDLGQELPEIQPIQLAKPEISDSNDQLRESVDSYVKYVAEDENAYQVRTRSQQLLEVAKRRSPRPPYPPLHPGPLHPAYRWLALAALGIVFSGLGALLLAPVAGLAALRAQKGNLSPTDNSRARLVVLLSGLLMAMGAGLAFLFWLHVRG